MKVGRREFLKLGAATAGAVAGVTAKPSGARAAAPDEPCVSMLYDATKCIGCRACQTVCRERLGLEPTSDADGLYDQPTDLSSISPTIISQYVDEDSADWSFVKHQCMHCLDPACASACLVNALERMPDGQVVYDVGKCIGCRYCMIACPFEVPTFEYDRAVPAIRKCDFCYDLTGEGEATRCASVCPTGAITCGDRADLIAQARARIYDEPDRYESHVYGEEEVGGTAALYIAGVSFDKLGLPTNLPNTPIPNLTKGFLNSVPLVILLWAAFGTGLHRFAERREAVAGEAGAVGAAASGGREEAP